MQVKIALEACQAHCRAGAVVIIIIINIIIIMMMSLIRYKLTRAENLLLLVKQKVLYLR